MNKIFVIGPAWVGDMVMAQSLFKVLKTQDSDVIIDVLAPDWSRPLLERMPEVSKTHSISIGHGALNLKERHRIGVNLRSETYAQAILLVNSWKSALIPWWANIPKRTGFLGECRIGLLNDIRLLDKKQLPRLVDRFVSLAYGKNTSFKQSVPFPRFKMNPDSVKKVIEKFSVAADLKHPILALCPGAEFGSSKRWPESYYAKVALAKQKEGWKVWLFGTQHEKAVAAHIQSKTNDQCVDFTGKTRLGEAIDLLSLATAVVTNDSGLMHIAAALNKPLIAIYGSTDPKYTPPLADTSSIMHLSLSCSPCFKRECPLKHHQCMQDLHPNKVLATLETMVA